MKKIKVSELPVGTTLKGLYTLGTDVNNNSVKVSLEFVEEKANAANDAASVAKHAASQANDAASAAAKWAEQCKDRFVTLNFGTNEETIQLANVDSGVITLSDVIATNVATLYITTGGYIKEPIDLTNIPNISISGKAFATFDIVRSGTGTASVGLKFKVQ